MEHDLAGRGERGWPARCVRSGTTFDRQAPGPVEQQAAAAFDPIATDPSVDLGMTGLPLRNAIASLPAASPKQVRK
jgi:hypothetical protein